MKATATSTLCAVVLLFSEAVSVVSAFADHGAYGDAPVNKPIAIQGLIYCKSGSKLIPLKGATARVTCLARNHMGLELAPFSVSSCPADDKGYFLAKLSPPATKYFKKLKWELKECKAYLEKSPLDECKVLSMEALQVFILFPLRHIGSLKMRICIRSNPFSTQAMNNPNKFPTTKDTNEPFERFFL